MKKTIIEYITNMSQEDIPKQVLQENRKRLNAFFSEQEMILKKGSQFIFKYAFYSVENPRKITKQRLFKEYEVLLSGLKSIRPERILNMEYRDVILYGDDNSPETQERLKEYLKQNDLFKVQLTFCDKENLSRKSQVRTYAELQKALFFCKRKKYLLLFVSVRDIIQDIRFFNLLEEFRVDFRCIDFPWFCKENMNVIKAVILYEKLQPKSI